MHFLDSLLITNDFEKKEKNMKATRFLCLILSLVMLCGLFTACGKQEAVPRETANSTAKAEEANNTTKAEENKADEPLYLNETITIGDCDIFIYRVLVSQSYKTNLDSYASEANDDKRFVTVYWNIHYNGKDTKYVGSIAKLTLEYGDGFIFESDEEYYSCTDYLGKVAFASNTNELEPLCEDKQVQTRFEVPLKALEGTDDLVIRINDEKKVLHLLQMDEKEHSHRGRPESVGTTSTTHECLPRPCDRPFGTRHFLRIGGAQPWNACTHQRGEWKVAILCLR